MQTTTSTKETKSLDLSLCVHHYTFRAPCPKSQGKGHRNRWSVKPAHVSSYSLQESISVRTTRPGGHLLLAKRSGCNYTVHIAEIQKMANAEWAQSFNSVRGPIERLGIIRGSYEGSPFRSATWKRRSGSQEI